MALCAGAELGAEGTKLLMPLCVSLLERAKCGCDKRIGEGGFMEGERRRLKLEMLCHRRVLWKKIKVATGPLPCLSLWLPLTLLARATHKTQEQQQRTKNNGNYSYNNELVLVMNYYTLKIVDFWCFRPFLDLRLPVDGVYWAGATTTCRGTGKQLQVGFTAPVVTKQRLYSRSIVLSVLSGLINHRCSI